MQCPCKKQTCSSLLLSLMVVIIAGCDRGLVLAPAEGPVTLDGKPVAQAGVLFAPIEGGPPATGATDAAGHFKLRTANRDGAKVGEHRVTITKKETRGLGPFGPTGPEGIKVIWRVPEKFSKTKTSGLTATVPGGEEFSFELTSR
jgi:hypothetical protein